ncbi:LysR substrate-binding domain-containing protein [Tardiphaga sp. 862_B3_N4_1]|jgi:DNA-binding transcriptional LysR family regulator|uniref:LysR substrate-binding domain-containing protein n=1 Tax=Tardiphaga TaxID=1395974 RepID=UPI0028604DE1|nr:LysR substrate-binding domain-containing protein [Tardiphaga robiniae]MDR6662647.1 DNA-binding transcriptional LysR family regulator [Tardiphaga robiniae]
MRRRIPSLGALMAFSAAAKHLSVTRAASELALTESAVSRQIAQLETQLGVKLFHRIKKRITLTRAGAAYSTRVAQTIERIERDALEIMGYEADGMVLDVAALPTVGAQWLIPRLPDFYARHPGVAVNVSARNTRFFFSETALDGALYFGQPDWPGTQADHLFDEILLPVGSPTLIGRRGELPPSEVAELRLLHLVTRADAWRRWFDAAELGGTNVIRGPRFDIQSTLISAASSGLGVALLPEFLISDQLRSGKLKVLSSLTLKSVGSYYFACPEEKAENPLLQAFRAWLLSQAQASAHPGSSPGALPKETGRLADRRSATTAGGKG